MLKNKFGLAFVIFLIVSFLALSYGSSVQSDEFQFEGVISEPEINPGIERLVQLGYIDSFEPSEDEDSEYTGVKINAPTAYPGLNLFSSFKTEKIYLMNMNGVMLNEWKNSKKGVWRFYRLMPDGSLIGIFHSDKKYLFKMDWDSNIRWVKKGSFHHDFSVDDEGLIYVLTGQTKKDVEYQGQKIDIFNNFIAIHKSSGEFIKKISIHHLLWNKITEGEIKVPYHHRIDPKNISSKEPIDIFHTNTVEVVTKDTKVAKKGDVIISLRHLDMIALVDLQLKKIKWFWGQDILDQPHKPTLLDNGNILVFDNGVARNSSRVLEVDPSNSEIVWSYGRGEGEGFFTPARGTVQKMPNGNIVICSADQSRLFEINPQREIVWEYLPSERMDDGKIPIIPRLIRIPLEEVQQIPDIKNKLGLDDSMDLETAVRGFDVGKIDT